MARPAQDRARPARRGRAPGDRPGGVHRRHAALDGAVEGGRRPLRPAGCDVGLRTRRAGRAGAALHPGVGQAGRHPAPAQGGGAQPDASGALAVSLPEACRLSDALASSLRARLGVDASEADTTARIRQLRAAVERVRDLVDREPASARDAAAAKLAKLDTRVSDAVARAQRGADTGGLHRPTRARCRPRGARPHRQGLEPPRGGPRRGSRPRTPCRARGPGRRAPRPGDAVRRGGHARTTVRGAGRVGPRSRADRPRRRWTPTWSGSTRSGAR